MGTTASVLLVSGGRYLIGQVGDSRVYLLRDGALLAAHEGSLVRAGAGGRRLPHAGAGALPPVQQRHHALRRGEPGRGARHLSRRRAAGRPLPRGERRAHGHGGRPPARRSSWLARGAGAQGAGADLRGERPRGAGQHHGDHRPGARRRARARGPQRDDGDADALADDETVASLAQLYLGNILYAIELAATVARRGRQGRRRRVLSRDRAQAGRGARTRAKAAPPKR